MNICVKRGLSGLGVFAVSAFKKGDRIIEYVGPRLTDAQTEQKRGKYLFEVAKNVTIDGSSRKNIARYINHACKPNCEAIIEGSRVFIFAKKRILPGEELTYHYGKEYFTAFIGKKCRCPVH